MLNIYWWFLILTLPKLWNLFWDFIIFLSLMHFAAGNKYFAPLFAEENPNQFIAVLQIPGRSKLREEAWN